MAVRLVMALLVVVLLLLPLVSSVGKNASFKDSKIMTETEIPNKYVVVTGLNLSMGRPQAQSMPLNLSRGHRPLCQPANP